MDLIRQLREIDAAIEAGDGDSATQALRKAVLTVLRQQRRVGAMGEGRGCRVRREGEEDAHQTAGPEAERLAWAASSSTRGGGKNPWHDQTRPFC